MIDQRETALEKQYETFRDFYPFYLSQHLNSTCRILHFVGSTIVIAVVAIAFISGNAWWFAAVPIAGYGFAWVGHFFFEKNRPATFTYPLYSFVGDWVMYGQLLSGRIPFAPRG